MKAGFESNKQDITYLDTACMGMVDAEVLAGIRRTLSEIENVSGPPTELVIQLNDYYIRARENVAKLMGADIGEIALVESTSHGLGLIAGSIPIEQKHNILVCDLEFFATTLCWHPRQEDIGFELRRVGTEHGEVKVTDFEARIDKNTRAIIVSSVQEVNGFRVDIEELGRLAKHYNCYLIVDGIQEAGALNVDLSKLEVDIYCSGGHKWLRNPFGMGFLYVNRKIVEDLRPGFYGYFNTIEPRGGWGRYLEDPERTPFDNLEPVKTAQKFETGGMGNYLGALGLYMSVKKILEAGMEHIEGKIRGLNDYLAEGLKSLDVNQISSICGKHRSGITTFSLPGGLERERRLNIFMSDNKVFTSLRYTSGIGGIRVSPHYYNSRDDIDKLLEMIEIFLS